MSTVPPLAHRAVVRVAADVTLQVASGVTVDQAADALLHELRASLPDLESGLTLHRADAPTWSEETVAARTSGTTWSTYLRRPHRAPHGRTRLAQRRALDLVATAEQAVEDAHRAANEIPPHIHQAALDVAFEVGGRVHEYAVQLAMLAVTYLLAVEAFPDGHLQRKILSRAGAACYEQVARVAGEDAVRAIDEAHQRLAAAGYELRPGGEPQ